MKNTSQNFSLGVFLTAFLIGSIATYFVSPLLTSHSQHDQTVETKHIHDENCLHDNEAEHVHDENCLHDDEAEHVHDENCLHDDEAEHVHDENCLHDDEAEHIHDENCLHDDEAEHVHDENCLHDDEAEHVHDENCLHDNELEHTFSENRPYGNKTEHIHEHNKNDSHNDVQHNHQHEEDSALALNVQALQNIGIEPGEAGMFTLKPTDYQKSFSFPGFVRYKPGRSLISVPSPAAGVVTKIYAEEGEALCPGEPLFEIQLTHEELTSCQLELLSLLRKRDLLQSEHERLAKLAVGTEPKTQREIELQIQENNSAIEAQKQALLFLGISKEMLEATLIQKQNMITSLTVRVPELEYEKSEIIFESNPLHVATKEHFKHVEHNQQLESIIIEKGQTVFLGAPLCIISDLHELWIEGKAFESDEGLINNAYLKKANVSAIFSNKLNNQNPDVVTGLSIRSVSNRLDPTARTFSCYIDLQNYLLNSPLDNSKTKTTETDQNETPLLNWRFKPGQRCELEIGTETLHNVFVVPVSAVAQDGGESFLFEYIGVEDQKPIWHKRPVVVLHQTSREVIVDNDGSIKANAKIAKKGAYQLYIALTNGGGKLQSACPCDDHEH